MEIKQKECFCPAFIKHFHLQAASKYAREVWEFVNLYSKTRGCNRFLAVQYALELMRGRGVFAARGMAIPPTPKMDAWIKEETKLGNPALKAKVAATQDMELTALLAWSVEVNQRIEDLVHGIGPFPGVRDVLEAGKAKADLIVVSQTPLEALTREWKENRMEHFLHMIAGQEHGTKTEHLKLATAGKYAPGHVLMVGDAPGDQKAAKGSGALFFPVIPGREDESWAELRDNGLRRFFDGTFAGEYQQKLIAGFDQALPEKPHWEKV